MSTPTASDDRLRALMATADPLAGEEPRSEHLWSRVADDLAEEPPVAARVRRDAPAATDGRRSRSFARRHWQAGLLAAAAVATLALAAGMVAPGLLGLTGGADSSASGGVAASADEGAATSTSPQAAASGEAPATGRNALQGGKDASASDSSTGGDPVKDPTLVRSGSVIVGTDDPQGGRDRFVAEIQGMGGTLVSETITSRGDPSVGSSRSAADVAVTYPYPYPTGPGIWLTVKVPAASYDQAMAAARSAGEVVQLQQSSYDVGTQITDVRARIAVLTASLKRLEGLMDEASSVSDVIRLESAIAERQAELDSLRAQQRDLADQTQTAQVSLTLMSLQDAQQSVDPQPQLTWWESFVRGLSQFWSWLGQALLIVSPLLIVGAILLWLRRRRGRRGGPASPETGGVPETP